MIQVNDPYTLTPEQEALLLSYVKTYVGDFRIVAEDKRVFFYVAAWQGNIAWRHVGSFSNPSVVVQAILDHPIYKNRSTFSPASSIRVRLAGLRADHAS